MLTTWLIELYVNDLGNLRDEERLEEHKTLQAEFHQFLASPSLQVREGEGEKGRGREEGEKTWEEVYSSSHSSSPGPPGGESEDHI